MAAERAWIDEMRSDTLTRLLLSRHQSLEVIPVAGYAPSLGFDLLVRITGTEARETPEFGIKVLGTRRPLNGRRRPTAGPNGTSTHLDDRIPVCFFLYNVVTEEGVYRWLREPIVEEPGDVWLRHNDEAASAMFERLDNQAVERIVDRVVAWFLAKERIAVAR